jgi:hypothetical protein
MYKLGKSSSSSKQSGFTAWLPMLMTPANYGIDAWVIPTLGLASYELSKDGKWPSTD